MFVHTLNPTNLIFFFGHSSPLLGDRVFFIFFSSPFFEGHFCVTLKQWLDPSKECTTF